MWMWKIELAGGATIEEAAARLVSEAGKTGDGAYTVFGNTCMVANPGNTAEAVIARFREDRNAKSAWFQTPEGIAFRRSLSEQP
jgi:hypothetical protein